MIYKLRQSRIPLLWRVASQPRDPLRPVVCRFLVTPFDVELTRAVSHDYLAFSGLGRWCYSFHNIGWNGLLRERWAPSTHGELVQYRRAAKIFGIVEATTSRRERPFLRSSIRAVPSSRDGSGCHPIDASLACRPIRR